MERSNKDLRKVARYHETGRSARTSDTRTDTLYLDIGEYDRAAAEVIKELPHINESYEFTLINANEGKKRAAACGGALIYIIRVCAEFFVQIKREYDVH